MTTIDDDILATVHGGNRVKLLEDLISRIGKADLSTKQIGKLGKRVDGYAEKNAAKSGGNAIAEGDFGASPSNFIQLRGD